MENTCWHNMKTSVYFSENNHNHKHISEHRERWVSCLLPFHTHRQYFMQQCGWTANKDGLLLLIHHHSLLLVSHEISKATDNINKI